MTSGAPDDQPGLRSQLLKHLDDLTLGQIAPDLLADIVDATLREAARLDPARTSEQDPALLRVLHREALHTLMRLNEVPDEPILVLLFWYLPALELRVAQRFPGIPRDERHDVATEALLAVWDKRHAFDPQISSIETWLNEHVHYAALNYLRSHSHIGDIDSFAASRAAIIMQQTPPEPDERVHATLERARAVIDRLPRKQREATMRWIEGEPYSLIAESMGIKEVSVRTNVTRGLEKLRRLLGNNPSNWLTFLLPAAMSLLIGVSSLVSIAGDQVLHRRQDTPVQLGPYERTGRAWPEATIASEPGAAMQLPTSAPAGAVTAVALVLPPVTLVDPTIQPTPAAGALATPTASPVLFVTPGASEVTPPSLTPTRQPTMLPTAPPSAVPTIVSAWQPPAATLAPTVELRVTELPAATPSPIPALPSATTTAPAPSAAPTHTATLAPTATDPPTPVPATGTPVPAVTRMPSATATPPPTATSVPSATETPPPTATMLPTATASPTATATPPPTPTIPPATAPPTPAVEPTVTDETLPQPDACVLYGIQHLEQRGARIFSLSLSPAGDLRLGTVQHDPVLAELALDPRSLALYGVTDSTRAEASLYRIEQPGHTLTPLGASGVSAISAMAFNPRDAGLWGWVPGAGLATIDPASGAATLVVPGTDQVDALAWSPDGRTIYGLATRGLWAYTPASTTATLTPHQWNGQAIALVALADGRLLIIAQGPQAGLHLASYHPDLTLERQATLPLQVQPVVSLALHPACTSLMTSLMLLDPPVPSTTPGATVDGRARSVSPAPGTPIPVLDNRPGALPPRHPGSDRRETPPTGLRATVTGTAPRGP